MPRSPIAYIAISFFVHATEDPEKVLEAAKNIISTVPAKSVSFKKNRLRGEYGNPIIYFKTRIKEESVLDSILKQVSSQLPSWDKERLLRELSRHLERGNLYIRLDKQCAFKGSLRLCREDPIHMRIRFRRGRTDEVIKACREIGLVPESSE